MKKLLTTSFLTFNLLGGVIFAQTNTMPQTGNVGIGTLSPSLTETQEIHTNIFGTLKPHVPNLNDWNADYAYKVTYLGHYKNATASEDTTSIIEPLVVIDKQESFEDFLTIFPNPNNGEFQITCTDAIQSIIIYNNQGEKILEVSDVNANKYEAKLILESGTYLVNVHTKSNVYIHKKIIVL